MIQSDSGKWLLTEDDIKIRSDDLEVSESDLRDDDKKIIRIYIETWFDVDQRFGTSTDGTDDYVNLYAEYEPTSEDLTLSYIIHYTHDDSCKEIQVADFDAKEKEVILRLMKQAGLDGLVKTMLRERMEDGFMEFVREAQTRITRFNPEDVLNDTSDLNDYLIGLIEKIELKKRVIEISTDDEAPIEAVRNLLKREEPLNAVYQKLMELYEGEIDRLGCYEVDSRQCYDAFEQTAEAEDDYEQ